MDAMTYKTKKLRDSPIKVVIQRNEEEKVFFNDVHDAFNLN